MRTIERPYATAERRRRYGTNLARRFARQSPYDYYATCFHCGYHGYLGYQVTYRGDLSPKNLICDNCWQDPIIQQWWHDHNWLSTNYMKAMEHDESLRQG